MDHVAIMKKSWGLTEKILSGEKKIESRWYKSKHSPWGKVNVGDIIYFKNTGEPVTLRAEVSKVLAFSNLTPAKVLKILDEFGRDDGISEGETAKYFDYFKDKKYCLLMFLNNVHEVDPFDIDKTGYGTMSAWLVVGGVERIKKKNKR